LDERMLRPGFISASVGAAVTLAGACSNATPPKLPSLSEITGTVSEASVVGAPTEVYARIARGAMACWFGSSGPLKANYVYHAEAEPAGQGGKAEIIIHERDRTLDTQKGEKAFRVGIAKEGEATSLAVENIKLPEPLAKSMEADVRRWGAGSIGCAEGDKGWEPQSPEAEAPPKAKKAKAPAKKADGV
jgi:hypothetical protein